MDPVSHHNGYKLCDSGKQQICMESFLILGFTSGDTETVFEMADGFFYVHTYFIGGVPFIRIPESARVCPQILFRINIKHPAAGGIRAWIFTMADTPAFPGPLIVFPFHFRAYKLHGRKPAAQMGSAPFPFHRKGGIFWTAGDPVSVQRTVSVRKGDPSVKGNISLFNGGALQEVFVDFNGIESGITQESLGIDEGMFPEEILQHRDEGFGIGKALILIRGVGFLLDDDIRVCIKEGLIVEGDVPDNAQPVCEDAELEGIAEVAVDVHLLNGRVRRSSREYFNPVFMWLLGGCN